MNSVLKPAIGMIMVIVVLAGLMVPFVSAMNDDIVEKNDNPVGSYMLRDARDNNSNVTVEITSSGVFVNSFNATSGYHMIIMDSGMMILYNGTVTIYDTTNDKYSQYTESGTVLTLKNGILTYTIGETEYTMPYENVLYPATRGNYSAYNNYTPINASIGDEVYLVSQEPGSRPKVVATYTNGQQSDLLGPITPGTSNSLVDYTGELTYTIPSSLSEDGKSWTYTGGRSIVMEGDTTNLNTILIAPNTYDTIGKMGMVITLNNLMPLFIGVIAFAAVGIYLIRSKQ